MKPRAIITYASVFCAGFAAAWALKKNAPTAAESAQELAKTSQHRSRQTHRDAAKATATKQRTEDLLKKLDDAGYDDKKKAVAMSEMETPDLLALILAISLKAGLTGLDYKEARKIQELAVEWSKRDLDAALSWANALSNPKDRILFMGHILDEAGEKDLDHALELAKQYCRDEKGALNLPSGLERKVFSLDADEMLKRAELFVHKSSGCGGSNIVFNADYDFRKALDGIAALESSLDQGQSLRFIPSNLIEEWAKNDPDAAWQWLAEGKKVSFNNITDFFEGYSSVASPEQTAQMLVQARDRFTNDGLFFATAWRVVAEIPSREIIQNFLREMPGNQQENINLLLKASSGSGGNGPDKAKELLLGQMSHEQRISAFTQDTVKDYLRHDTDSMSTILKRLGHSDAEIQQMLPKKK